MDDQTQFLQQLEDDLKSKNVKLPSFPDVVIKIRTALEDPTCSSERLASVVRNDPVLVARLLMAANSAFHNRAGIAITDLDLAISRLGFELVRNSAITLAVEQIYQATQHPELRDTIKSIWSSSLSLASMCFVLARNMGTLNSDNAFLCGLLHEIGKLYIFTRARDYPDLLGNPESLASVLDQWHPSVGKSIVEAWGFPDEIAISLDVDAPLANNGSPVTFIDVVCAAKLVLDYDEDEELDGASAGLAGKLNISADSLPGIREAYDQHAQSLQISVN